MFRNVATWVHSYSGCAALQYKGTIALSSTNFRTLPPDSSTYIDIVGQLPRSGKWKFRHLLTAIYRYTRWPVAMPLAGTAECTSAFLSGWVASPEIVTTDRSRQFTSNHWRCTLQLLCIKAKRTTAYHLQANATVDGSIGT